ncbi:MAG TPA: hypothetical protein VFK74_05790, partial [Azospira sp.]|nr:hypothetical protein [Azospira sp.]
EMLKQQAQEMAVDSIKTAALFKSSLSGISWVAGAGFPMADKWAFERMAKLGADPLAGITLHYKLASRGISLNSFVFDEERVGLITQITEAQGLGNEAKLALGGNDPRGTLQVIEEYPADEKAKQEGAQELAANLAPDGPAPVLPETPQGATTGTR